MEAYLYRAHEVDGGVQIGGQHLVVDAVRVLSIGRDQFQQLGHLVILLTAVLHLKGQGHKVKATQGQRSSRSKADNIKMF